MLLLWVVVVVVFGSDVVLSMEGPRGKVTREMCSLPAAQVPEEHWPYCCEGYGNHCEDFAASCYLDCQPVVSSGSDVTLVEERPGFCCALYNFCCIREFSKISGNTQNAQVEEQFPTFHRFHVPGKTAPRWSPAPRKNIVRQDVNNDITETQSPVNRVGRTRSPSRNNGPRERLDRIESRSSKSLDEIDNEFSFDQRRSEQQHSRFNSQLNVVKPQRSSKPNVIKPKRNQVRFPQRPQTDKTKNTETAITSEIPTSNMQSDDSFGKTATTKKAEIKDKNIEYSKDNKTINQNAQQLNSEAENRKITLNRAGVNRRVKLSNTNVNLKANNDDNEELTPTNQPTSVSLPTTNGSQSKTKDEDDSENKHVKEEKTQGVTTEQPTTRRRNHGRKVMIGRRVLVRTAPRKIIKTEQEISKTVDSVQSKSVVSPTSSRRTLISNRQTPKTTRNNVQENSKSTDSEQNRQESKPVVGRRTLIRNRQSPKIINNNDQDISKSTDFAQSKQELKPTTSRRTILNNRQNVKKIRNNAPAILRSTDSVQGRQGTTPTASRRTNLSNRQTGSRRSRPTVSSTKETSQEETNAPKRSVDQNRGRRIKQTVRRVSTDGAPKESDKKDEIFKAPKVNQPETTYDIKTKVLNTDVTPSYLPQVSNTDKNPSYLPLKGEKVEAPQLDLDEIPDSIASKLREFEQKILNNWKISVQEKDESKDETETKSPLEVNRNAAVAEVNENTQTPLAIVMANKVDGNQKEIENSPSNINNPRHIRIKSKTSIPVAVTNSRNKAKPSNSENNAVTSSRTRSRGRSSRTKNQDQTLREETTSTATTNTGSTRTQRIEPFGRKDVSKSTVQNSPINTENTSRRTTPRRGRQPI